MVQLGQKEAEKVRHNAAYIVIDLILVSHSDMDSVRTLLRMCILNIMQHRSYMTHHSHIYLITLGNHEMSRHKCRIYVYNGWGVKVCWTQVQERLRDILDIAMTSSAFAALKSDGSCIMWGNIAAGGDCRSSIQESDYVGMLDGGVSSKKKVFNLSSLWCMIQCQEQLVNVRQIVASRMAFAAIRSDGRVVTWGTLEGIGQQQVQDT